MLDKISIQGFKAIDKLDVELRNLTLLVGMNSSGKSTVIQSILLAIQNLSFNNASYLNGLLVSLGDFAEVRNYIVNSKEINISLLSNDSDSGIYFSFFEKNGKLKLEKKIHSKELQRLLKYQNKRVRYLSSERIGSRDVYQVNYSQDTDVGFLGEYSIDYFEQHKSDLVDGKLIKDKEMGETLDFQVNYWLEYIVSGQLMTNSIEGTDIVKASYRIHNNSRYFRPKNVGAGVGYLISILISLLSAKPDHLVIIENPEIHLHPRAQARLMEFLVFISAAGVKLIVETHSDHIFNGIRKSIFKKEITPDMTSIYYFDLDEKSISNAHKIELNDEGKIKNHIEGLFDQFDEDLDILLGL